MIPVLMPADVTRATLGYNGYGFLKDCITCKVTEELNGIYEIELTIPYETPHGSEIEPDMCIKAKAGEKQGKQLFRIYRITKSLSGILKIYAQHISYDLANNPVIPFSVSSVSAQSALNALSSHCYYAHNFIFTTDKETISSLNFSTPQTARKILGGVDGSILDNFGGEYEFDNFTVKLWKARGADNGVTIYHGKNLTGFDMDSNIQSTYTGLYPFAIDENENVITLSEKVIETSTFSNYAEPKVIPIDLSEKFEDKSSIDETALRAATNNYIAQNKISNIYQNTKINFVQLWKSQEYKNVAPLEQINIGDTITIRYFKIGVSAKAKVVKTVYDSLSEQYDNIEIGTAKLKFGR